MDADDELAASDALSRLAEAMEANRLDAWRIIGVLLIVAGVTVAKQGTR